MKRLVLLAALLASPAVAQISYAPAAPVTSFSGTTCTNCTMADPMFTGSPSVNGNKIVTSPTTATASGLAYFHRYAAVSLSVPGVSIGGTGTATASVPGTVAGDQCFVAPTSGTTALSYIMGAGWVSVDGTVKVALAAPSVLAISSSTVSVNMLCAQ